MMPPLSTPVAITQLPVSLTLQSKVMSIGSCFSDEVGQRMLQHGFNVMLNPFGTLYNPASIASALGRIMANSPIAEADLVQQQGLWHSWHHHGSFSRSSQAEVLHLCNSSLQAAHQALGTANLLVVTFGTAWVFHLGNEGGPVVANCHKVPASQFTRTRMSVDEITALWQPLMQQLHKFNNQLQVLFTVSPIRHMADGAHGNQLSKATLLLAVDRLVATNTQACYFPAYEVVIDELRDYRYYAADMVHPSATAVDVVWHHFQQATMSAAVQQQAHINAKQWRQSQHRPLHQ